VLSPVDPVAYHQIVRIRTIVGSGILLAAALAYRWSDSDAVADVGELVARIADARRAPPRVRPVQAPPSIDEPDADAADPTDPAGDDVPRENGTGGRGMIRGWVTEGDDRTELGGVVVTATGPDGATITAISEDDGRFAIAGLAGSYKLTFYYVEFAEERDATIWPGLATSIYESIPLQQAPTIDPESTVQGITIDKNYIRNIPVPGRTFEDALGAAAGSQVDAYGISFSGVTSLENTYVIDDVEDD
jgi:hypothetical protein